MINILYSEVAIFCFIILTFIYHRVRNTYAKGHETFLKLTLVSGIYSLVDAVWGMCYLATGTDQKNIKGFRSYPDEVQKRVYEDSTLGRLAPKKSSVLITFFLIFLCLLL